MPERKILQGRRVVRDIIAIGGTKTYQLNNLEILFQDEQQRKSSSGRVDTKEGGSPTTTSLKQMIEL